MSTQQSNSQQNANLEMYNSWRKVPKEFTSEIKYRDDPEKVLTEIKPMWRIEKLTERFGPVGIGWLASEKEHWIQQNTRGDILFVKLALRFKTTNEWSAEIEGVGGSVLNKFGNPDDDAYKKAYTDALSSCCKMLGIGADVYLDQNSDDNSKYRNRQENAANGNRNAAGAQQQAGNPPAQHQGGYRSAPAYQQPQGGQPSASSRIQIVPGTNAWNSVQRQTGELLNNGVTPQEIYDRITARYDINKKNFDELISSARQRPAYQS